MELSEMRFIPHSDTGANELEIISQHKNLITKNQYDEAVTLLDKNNISNGVRASLLNSIQNKIRTLQEYVIDDTEGSPIYISETEPTDTEFADKVIWSQSYE